MQEEKIVLFDGVCNLCNGLVKFIIKKDPAAKFKFAALQRPAGKFLLEKSGIDSTTINTVVYIRNEKIHFKSDAILFILKDIGGGWKIFFLFILIPKFIRDFVYDVVSKTRYSVFGKRKTCMVPGPEIQVRFYNL